MRRKAVTLAVAGAMSLPLILAVAFLVRHQGVQDIASIAPPLTDAATRVEGVDWISPTEIACDTSGISGHAAVIINADTGAVRPRSDGAWWRMRGDRSEVTYSLHLPAGDGVLLWPSNSGWAARSGGAMVAAKPPQVPSIGLNPGWRPLDAGRHRWSGALACVNGPYVLHYTGGPQPTLEVVAATGGKAPPGEPLQSGLGTPVLGTVPSVSGEAVADIRNTPGAAAAMLYLHDFGSRGAARTVRLPAGIYWSLSSGECLSPDGKEIAVVYETGDAGGPPKFAPAWSRPLLSRLFPVIGRLQNLSVVRVDGTHLRVLGTCVRGDDDNSSGIDRIAWSPDGKRLAVTAHGRLCLVPAH